jgi:RimJ/RimL family protein N-acetyltransferase
VESNTSLKTLKSPLIQLDPLSESHRAELYNAAQDEAIWTYTTSKAMGDGFHTWFDKALATPSHRPFVVRRLDDQKIIGSTRFYDINAEHKRLSIGYTWYIPEVWGSYVNTECKYLLLSFAFEEMMVNRVEFSIDSRNARSRAAVKKLGAIEEGVLRQHMIVEGAYVRDTVMHSIIKQDWPVVKLMLESRRERAS